MRKSLQRHGFSPIGEQAIAAETAYTRSTHIAAATPVTQTRTRVFVTTAILLLLGSIILRAWALGRASYWTDEALTALRAQAPLDKALESLFGSGNQGPLYFLALRLFPHANETLLRWPSVMLGMMGIALFIYLALHLFGSREIALWTGLLLATNPFHIWLSRTARPYTLLLVLTLLASWCFLKLFRTQSTARRLWIAFILTSMGAYLTHYTAVALPAAQGMLILLNWRTHRRWLIWWVGAQAIAVIPALLWMLRQAQEPLNIGGAWVPAPTPTDVPLTLWSMTLGYEGLRFWFFLPGMLVVGVGVVLGTLRLIRSAARNTTHAYWLWLIVMPFIPTLMVSQFVSSFYVDRYFTVFLPALLILVVAGWTQFAPRVWYTALVIIALTSLGTVAISYRTGDYQRADWRTVIADLAEHVAPEDRLLIGRWNERTVFAMYADPVDPTLSTRLVALDDMPENPPDTRAFEATADRLWVLYRNPIEDIHRLNVMPEFDPFDPTLSPLGEWLAARRGQVIEQRTYNGVIVLLLAPAEP